MDVKKNKSNNNSREQERTKPNFSVDQVIPASKVVKNFAETRKTAKSKPLFISQNNNIDTVLLSYDTYEEMYAQIEYLKEVISEYQYKKDGVK